MACLGCLRCAACGDLWALATDGVCMSADGAGGTFVNAHGYVHDMATLRSARGVRAHGRPTAEDSWFPGFAWSLAHCAGCYAHAGWRFTAVPGMQGAGAGAGALQMFWGLKRGAFAQVAHGGDSGSDSEAG